MESKNLFLSSPPIHRWGLIATPDINRSIFLEFDRQPKETKIIKEVLSFSAEETESLLNEIKEYFLSRHTDLEQVLLNAGERALKRSGFLKTITKEEKKNISKQSIILIGAYSSREYSSEAAALTNPSIVKHPDQSNLEESQVRMILSLRGIGEGHISSITFVTIILDTNLEPIVPIRISPQISGEFSSNKENGYSVTFSTNSDISQRVLSPRDKSENKGMEDARFVEVKGDDGKPEYRATYTAYDGKNIHPRLIITKDFLTFQILDLLGPASRNKGMAIFPEKINGKWFALCRGDGYTSSISESIDGVFWETPIALEEEDSPWNLVIKGNAGSPHLIDEGWLVITHGVGPMRTYYLGAMLLDRENPTKILGSLRTPLLAPTSEESRGYVPNVIYSCGSIIIKDTLWLPYGVSDRGTSLASISIKDLVKEVMKV